MFKKIEECLEVYKKLYTELIRGFVSPKTPFNFGYYQGKVGYYERRRYLHDVFKDGWSEVYVTMHTLNQIEFANYFHNVSTKLYTIEEVLKLTKKDIKMVLWEIKNKEWEWISKILEEDERTYHIRPEQIKAAKNLIGTERDVLKELEAIIPVLDFDSFEVEEVQKIISKAKSDEALDF